MHKELFVVNDLYQFNLNIDASPFLYQEVDALLQPLKIRKRPNTIASLLRYQNMVYELLLAEYLNYLEGCMEGWNVSFSFH